MTDEPDRDWLAWSLRDAREKVAAWPEWKREAFRVLPDDEAPERRDGGEMTDDPDRRDDPRWDARASEWARIEPDGDGWCETVHGSLVQLLGDVMERETRGRDAALDAADRLADAADRIHDMRGRDPDRELADALAVYLVARGAR